MSSKKIYHSIYHSIEVNLNLLFKGKMLLLKTIAVNLIHTPQSLIPNCLIDGIAERLPQL